MVSNAVPKSNLINLVRHDLSTAFETGLRFAIVWKWTNVSFKHNWFKLLMMSSVFSIVSVQAQRGFQDWKLQYWIKGRFLDFLDVYSKYCAFVAKRWTSFCLEKEKTILEVSFHSIMNSIYDLHRLRYSRVTLVYFLRLKEFVNCVVQQLLLVIKYLGLMWVAKFCQPAPFSWNRPCNNFCFPFYGLIN